MRLFAAGHRSSALPHICIPASHPDGSLTGSLPPQVVAQHADAFAKAFVHLGYTSLGEPGVVRCDLFVEDVRATTVTDGGPAPLAAFLARKVFKTSADAAAHAGSEHYVAWAARVQPMLGGNGLAAARQELDTIYPHTSPFPFRSGWQTV